MVITDGARAQALRLVARFEGLRLQAYQDDVGVWTVGYGCTGPDIGPGVTWTQEQADAELGRRIDAFVSQMAQGITVQPTDNEMAAMASLCYNIGSHGFLNSTVLRRFNEGAILAAADAFLLWNKAGGRVLDGLVKRRAQERKVFLGLRPA